jgi:hypothetical protein
MDVPKIQTSLFPSLSSVQNSVGRQTGSGSWQLRERSQLEDCVPVSAGPACAELLFSRGIREPRAADIVRVHDVKLAAFDLDDLPASDCLLKGRHTGATRRVLERHDEEVTRIARSFRPGTDFERWWLPNPAQCGRRNPSSEPAACPLHLQAGAPIPPFSTDQFERRRCHFATLTVCPAYQAW